MNNESCIDEVVKLYFDGYSIEEALKIIKNERKQEELKKIAEVWESKTKKAPIRDARGWVYQQPRII